LLDGAASGRTHSTGEVLGVLVGVAAAAMPPAAVPELAVNVSADVVAPLEPLARVGSTPAEAAQMQAIMSLRARMQRKCSAVEQRWT
jgi:hypothetical protein